MKWLTRSGGLILLLVFFRFPVQTVLIRGQTPQSTQAANPVAGDPQAIREGASLCPFIPACCQPSRADDTVGSHCF